MTWTKSGKMLATNIGQKSIESLYMISAGHDYGWPIREGSFLVYPKIDVNKVYPLPANDKKYKVSYPVAEFDHDEGNAISGGFEYWGNAGERGPPEQVDVDERIAPQRRAHLGAAAEG